jgi:hypothetical protein
MRKIIWGSPILLYSLLGFLLLFSFQNCLFKNTSKEVVASNNGGNGSGYDGKLFFGNFAGTCNGGLNSQGTTASDVIEISDDKKTGFIVVQNCQPLATPIPVDVSSLMAHNDSLIVPGNQIFDVISEPSAMVQVQNISELACRANGYQLKASNCNFNDCLTTNIVAIDTQLTPLLNIAYGDNGEVLTSLRKVKVNIGLYQPDDIGLSQPPVAVIKNAEGSIFDKPVNQFNPLSYFDSFVPILFDLNSTNFPNAPSQYFNQGYKYGEINTYHANIETVDFKGSIDFTIAIINKSSDVTDSKSIYLTSLKVIFGQAVPPFIDFNKVEYNPYIPCLTQ